MKAEVAAFTHDMEEISGLCEQWGLKLPLRSHKRLFGGYSGSNYRVEAADGSVAVLKICHGYDRAEVEAQARIMAHLRAGGFDGACLALPLSHGLISKLATALGLGGGDRFVALARDGSPACLLTFVDGVAADKVIGTKHVPCEKVLWAVGEGLGRMHSVLCPPGAGLRSILDGGGCDLRKHVSDVYGDSVSSCAAIAGHDFLPFYWAQREKLRAGLAADGLPQGPLHGDPFLDNVLVDASTGELRGFVDFEDVCVGPLIFDVACCAAAACFRAGDNAFDVRRLRALLGGYDAARQLTAKEAEQLVGFMQIALLCNCAWRFKNFNVDHRELSDCRDAHRELQQRIEDLDEGSFTAGAIEDTLDGIRRARSEGKVVRSFTSATGSSADAELLHGRRWVHIAAAAAALFTTGLLVMRAPLRRG